MDEEEFFNNLGFDSNPFQFTNADDEDRLEKYFIPPPYFDSVWGNPENPKSVVVFAPRGGGKTAQRKMIEYESKINGKVLCVNYSRFEFSKKVQNIELSDHLQKIIQIIVTGILTKLNEEPALIKHLDEADKKYLKTLVNTYLGNISEQDFKMAIDSLSNFSDKAKKFWNEYLGTINTGINIVLSKLGLSGIEVKKIEDSDKLDKSLKYQLEKLQKIIFKMNFTAIYILIDKVDEDAITGNDANLSARLIEPLLKDLDTLEMKGYGFKFFLWENLERYYNEYGRKDRINYYSLIWKDAELKKMLSKRLEAYSNNKIDNFSQIVEYGYDINQIIILFAQKSPRDVIRIIQDIISEQREINPNARKISKKAIMRGLDVFSEKKAREIINSDAIIRDLRKINQVEFTINFLASNIYKCPQNTVRSKIKKWNDLGIIENIGTEKGGKRTRPVNKYCISDIRIAKIVLPEISIEDFLNSKYKKCPKCDTDLFRDWDYHEKKLCHNCNLEIRPKTTRKIEKHQSSLSDYADAA